MYRKIGHIIAAKILYFLIAKKGPKPKQIIDTTWRSELAYTVGLIATDGCLSSSGLLIDLTSKDREQLLNFSKCLGRDFTIGTKLNGTGHECLRIQFKNRLFYDFLLSVGLTPKKSLTMGEIFVPGEYFFDFLRGCFDGDGTFYSYWDPRWRSSHMFYVAFASGSRAHIEWLQYEIEKRAGVRGHIAEGITSSALQLRYAKKESLEIINKMYYNPDVICLSRKKIKIEKALAIEHEQQLRYS